MKSNVLSGLVALGLVLAACDDDVTGVGGSGAGSVGGEGSGGDPGIGGLPNVGGGDEGGGGSVPDDGNNSIATAEPMEDNGNGGFGILGELDPPASDVDFFSFTAAAGPYVMLSDAKPDANPEADGFLDLVVTLLDSEGNQIAQNDDPFPRFGQDSEFYTVLPEAGVYYLKVQEYCNFDPSGPQCTDRYFEDMEPGFAVNMLPLDPATNSNVPEAPEPNDLPLTASVMEYEPNSNTPADGDYFLSVAVGEWGTTPDTDGISLTIPADIAVDAGARPNARFYLPPGSVDGSGSSLNAGIIEVVDVVGLQTVARFDMTNESSGAASARASLNFPVTAGGQYLLRLSDGAPAMGGAPFYFLLHGVGSGNPVETQEVANNSLISPEALTASDTSYFVEGNLGVADVDYFSVSALDTNFSVACSSGRVGSGVQNFKASVLKFSDGTALSGTANGTESASESIFIEDEAVGAESTLVVKLEKSGQDATNLGSHYLCGLHFAPPAP